MDPRLPGDAAISAVSALYVVLSLRLGRTISPNPFSWLAGRCILDRNRDTGVFWLSIAMFAVVAIASGYWTMRLLISN